MKLQTIPQAMLSLYVIGQVLRVCHNALFLGIPSEIALREQDIWKGGITNDGADRVGLFGLSRNSPETNVCGGLEPKYSCLQQQ